MDILYVCPHWGQENVSPEVFIKNVIDAGYDGVEINIGALQDIEQWLELLNHTRQQHSNFIVVAQMVLNKTCHTVTGFCNEMIHRLDLMLRFKPVFINAHTGKDYFSFEDNCTVIQAAIDFSRQYNVPIYHETHRGHFSFALHTMPRFLKKFPELQLVADYSHWCAVSESMLDCQTETLQSITSHVKHIHARVGWEQGPQLANPFTVYNKGYLDSFTQWWKAILKDHQNTSERFTICPEAGPVPYMPADPYTGKPLASQWEINTKMLAHLRREFADLKK